MKYYIATWIKSDGTRERGMYEDDSMRNFRRAAQAIAKRNGWTLVNTQTAQAPGTGTKPPEPTPGPAHPKADPNCSHCEGRGWVPAVLSDHHGDGKHDCFCIYDNEPGPVEIKRPDRTLIDAIDVMRRDKIVDAVKTHIALMERYADHLESKIKGKSEKGEL